ncbi:hypothetical protein BC828DRAFT_410184, partial [Blastocladiella britannica]
MTATLDWWRAEYVGRSEPLFPVDKDFPTELALCPEDGMVVVRWWRDECTKSGREFTWKPLDAITLWRLVIFGSLSLCQWWWGATVRRLGIQSAKRLLPGILDTICEYGRTDLLDWHWDLHATSNGENEFPRTWRPRRPFVRLDVLQWWETKVDAKQMDAGVFDIKSRAPLTKMDVLFEKPTGEEVDVEAVDWYWARPDHGGLEARLSQKTLSPLMRYRNLDLLQWYLDNCTPESPLPALTLNALASMVSQGRVDLAEQMWRISVAHDKPLTFSAMDKSIDTLKFHRRVAAPAVLAYLWDICARIGVRFEP